MEASTYFDAVRGYKRSNDYLVLISAYNDCDKLIPLIGFEDADELLLKYEDTAIEFLQGYWSNGNYYFNFKKNDSYTASYNLPSYYLNGYFFISNGVYSVGNSALDSDDNFKFTVIDKDTITVYCYKNGNRYTLYRQ